MTESQRIRSCRNFWQISPPPGGGEPIMYGSSEISDKSYGYPIEHVKIIRNQSFFNLKETSLYHYADFCGPLFSWPCPWDIVSDTVYIVNLSWKPVKKKAYVYFYKRCLFHLWAQKPLQDSLAISLYQSTWDLNT